MTELSRVNRCQFCGKTFVRKSWFARHTCAKKKKFEESKDIHVQHGFRVYRYWLTAMNMVKRGSDPAIEKFLKSPHKKLFVSLIPYCREHGISSVYSYIDWVIAKNIKSSLWTSEDPEHIAQYKAYADEDEDPEDQALCLVREIERWVLENPAQRTVDAFFDKLTPGSILTLVRQQKIKPWPLLTYPKIADKWLEKDVYNPEVFYRINDIINCEYWAEKISTLPEAAEMVELVMDQLWAYQT